MKSKSPQGEAIQMSYKRYFPNISISRGGSMMRNFISLPACSSDREKRQANQRELELMIQVSQGNVQAF